MQTSLQDDSGLPRDQYVNVLHVESIVPVNANFNAWCDGLFGFYDLVRPYLSPVVAQFGGITKIYQVGQPLMTPPVYQQNMDFTSPPGGSPLPGEVASVLSYKGAAHPGWRLQSTRGRMYLGPLSTSATSVIAGLGVGVIPAFRTAATNAFKGLCAAIAAANGTVVVYSKLHGAVTTVNSCFMNDEFDTVRTRGKRETARTVLSIP